MNLGSKKRTIDFPIQIVRFKVNLTDINLDCDSSNINYEFHERYVDTLLNGPSYTGIITCQKKYENDIFTADINMDAYNDDAVV